MSLADFTHFCSVNFRKVLKNNQDIQSLLNFNFIHNSYPKKHYFCAQLLYLLFNLNLFIV